MLKIKPPVYKFCPFCGSKLDSKKEGGKRRKYCSNCDWVYYPHVASGAAAIISKNNKILLAKRRRFPFAGSWVFPGGFVDYGEHPRETVVREIKEETDLKVEIIKLLEVYQFEREARAPGLFGFFFLVKIVSGKVSNLDKRENSKIEWFALDNLPKLALPVYQGVLEKYKKEITVF